MLELLQFGLIVKLFFVVLTLFYVVFLLVVYRQISLMTQVLDSHLSPLIRVVALGQIVAAVFLLVLALILA
jgi:hypothetical protein